MIAGDCGNCGGVGVVTIVVIDEWTTSAECCVCAVLAVDIVRPDGEYMGASTSILALEGAEYGGTGEINDDR